MQTYKILSRLSPEDVERFWAKVQKSQDCWLWQGAPNSEGYGFLWAGGRKGTNHLVHRISYEIHKGPIPDGYDIHLDHLCRVRMCVNPSHLEAVTGRVNTLRGTAPSSRNATATHCIRGHAFDPSNTRNLKSGKRECKACRRAHTVRMNMKKYNPERFAKYDAILGDLLEWLAI